MKLYFILILLPIAIFAETLQMGTFDSIPPYTYKDGNNYRGIDVEIAQEVFKRLNQKIKITAYPTKRLKSLINEGKIHGIIGLFQHSRHYIKTTYSIPLYNSKMVVFGHKSLKEEITSKKDLQNKTIGLLLGYNYGKELDYILDLNKDYSNTNEIMIKKLFSGRLQLILAEDKPFWYSTIKQGKTDFIELFTFSEKPISMAFSQTAMNKETDRIVKEVNEIINKLHQEGFIKNVILKYRYNSKEVNADK